MLLGRFSFGDNPTTAMVFAVFKSWVSREDSCNDDKVCIGVKSLFEGLLKSVVQQVTVFLPARSTQ